MKLRNLVLGIILFGLILPLSSAHPARANAAPPPPLPASNIGPGEEQTMVQMVSERVEIEVTGEQSAYIHHQDGPSSYYEEYGYEARVNAAYTMHNRGEKDESIAVHFPLMYLYEYLGEESIVRDFHVFVGGQELNWVHVEYHYSDYLWAKFDVTFPDGKDVVIKVNYKTHGYGQTWAEDQEFNYILETGAGWYDSIDEADLILRLPYHASPENVYNYPEGAEFVGPEVRWHFEGLEPTSDDNWTAKIVRPAVWQNYIDAQKKSEQRPNDIDALVEYAWACFRLSTNPYIYYSLSEHNGYLFEECKNLFNRAEELGANSPDFHTGIALVLYMDYVFSEEDIYYSYVDHMYRYYGDETYDYIDLSSPLIQKALKHIDKALWIDPHNDLAQQLFFDIDTATTIDLSEPGPSKTPTLTLTEKPARTITITPTITTSPTSTPAPTRTSTSTRTSKSSLPPTRTRTPAIVTRTPTRTSTPQPEVAGDNNAWLVGAIALIVLIALVGGGFVWVWVEKQKA
ncbi:MAG: hypothetical protein JXB38_21515 [Anaerolineales bacterium]|nr:hypothetical protein [Anaerolineales bacterium]